MYILLMETTRPERIRYIVEDLSLVQSLFVFMLIIQN